MIGLGLGFIAGTPSFLSVVVISVIFVVALGLFFSGHRGSKPPSKNPFAEDCTRPPKPVETDQSVRDKVIKQGFTSSKVPDSLDAVVVGSGIGGLALAATMAKAGKKVLVLEQHDQSGGCCHSFVEKGFEFDVGIHYCGEMHGNTLTQTIIDQLTEGQLVWEQVDEVCDHVSIGTGGKRRTYEIKTGSRKIFRDNLVRQFPDEEAAIDEYMALLKKSKKALAKATILKILPKWLSQLLVSTGIIHFITGFFKDCTTNSLKQVIERLTENQDLRTVFSYCFGDYGTPPDKCPFAMQAALVNHFSYGGYYPRGGASEIAFHLIPVIERAGGRCLVRAPVTEIVLNKTGQATGVVVTKGQNKVTINSPMVVSDAGIYNTAKLLTPNVTPSIKEVIGQREEGLHLGYGGFSAFIGLDGSSADLGLPARQTWSFSDNKLSETFWGYLGMSVSEVLDSDVPLVFISFPSAKDSSWEQRYPGKSVCTLVTVVNYDWFRDWEEERLMHRGDGYESIKDAIGKKMWEHVLRVYPQLEGKVEYFETGSPLTNNYYLGANQGEMYGLDHDQKRFSAEASVALHPQTNVPNLYLTGQDVFMCGFAGGLYAAIMASCHTLNRNIMFDVMKLKGKIAKQRKNKAK